jgi:protocatechuate 3,4-dioxygenase beta subunit
LKDITIRLTRPSTVSGSVVDAAGKPVANREVRAVAADLLENRYYDPTTRTDKNGRFELKFVRPGEHNIQAAPFWLRAKNAPDGTSVRVKAEAGQTTADVKLNAGQDER